MVLGGQAAVHHRPCKSWRAPSIVFDLASKMMLFCPLPPLPLVTKLPDRSRGCQVGAPRHHGETAAVEVAAGRWEHGHRAMRRRTR